MASVALGDAPPMSSLADQKAYLLQLDNRDQFRPGLDSGPWITVYRNVNTETESSGIFCALIPSASLDDVLREPSWDLRIGSGMPGCRVRYEGDSEVTSYDRFGAHGGIEPLIILRSFHGVRERYVEVLEEFRLFHNLYHDRQSDQYIKFDSISYGKKLHIYSQVSYLFRSYNFFYFFQPS